MKAQEGGAMRRIRRFCLLLALFCALPLGASAAAQGVFYDAPPLLRVGLWTKQATIMLSANAPFALFDAASGKCLARYKAGARAFAVAEQGLMKLDGKPLKAARVLARLEKAQEGAGIEVNRKRYRGDIELFLPDKAGITVVNTLPMEAYLYGIVPGEMPVLWPMEAVKAQAVAARTFALFGMRKHEAEDFNVCATTHCQVYGGMNAEAARGTQAVDDTRGLAALYGGRPINAVFHSSSGGWTENSEDVWGAYLPYLRSVRDYDETAPSYKWEKRFTARELEQKLAAMGHAVGTLQALEVSPLKRDGVNTASDRTGRGRVKQMRFIGDKGSVLLTGAQTRDLLGLHSALFEARVIVPSEKEIEVPIGYYYKKRIAVDLPPYAENGLLTDTENIRRIHGRAGEQIVLEGFGWGHGLGMSQWGAKALAEKAAEDDATYFKQILAHYYQGIVVRKVY